ncbi:Predicted metal-dependent hydrolase, TIM-barrel fold [Robiginitalea myxolifaciens]|uniref:Predicted metal-dependent hydrolase, TIM-barrel fold n=1 Tax=Robiginitalea myxolifaciens TaxID=400055 RepID=A0A1I6HKK6_9FLAO|nr:amidohydrolase family protein [Robiginitalea myxolifaciens]SFR55003.1 Predicted metal-dependent hydrolase, TIM-barrel fold [Robiginitalea myxolifaciens]
MEIFDSHFHIIDPRFPLVENSGYLPPTFTTENYAEATSKYKLVGGAVVSGSFQAFDQEYLADALTTLGDNFVGVANIPYDITDNALERLDQVNVVAVRFNVKRGGSEEFERAEELSNRLYEKFGWHTELYIDSTELAEYKSVLENIPRFSIDHLGLSRNGLEELYYWVEKGVRVKATGFGRLDFEPLAVMKQIYEINPRALLFGTDLPSTRAKVPFTDKDVLIIEENFTLEEQANIFYRNARDWYMAKKN